MSTNKWADFWTNKTSPLHRHDTEDWYQLYAQELNLLFEAVGYHSGPVLEHGCGNGALFDYLRIRKEEYVGIDISDSMLAVFRRKHPEISLSQCDASLYKSDTKFRLIFSNAVAQHFDRPMLRSTVKVSLDMLDHGGTLLMANIPSKVQKKAYYSQLFAGHSPRGWKQVLAAHFPWLVSRKMGYWYAPQDFLSYKEKWTDLRFFGSLFYPYRFTVAITKKVK